MNNITLKNKLLKMESVNCPTCGADSRKKLIHKRDDDISFYRCLQCDIEYASPRLVESELLLLYEGDTWRDLSEYDNWTYKNWKDGKGQHYYLIEQNVKLVKKYLNKGSSVLDVGCDIGLTVKSLEENGFYSEGLEVSTVGAKIAKEKTRIKVHNMELGHYKSEIKFDGILLLDVLEHLYNPVKVLTECNDHMRQGGYIFIHVPHSNGLSTRLKRFLHMKGLKKGYKHFGFPAHIYAFNKRSLKAMLAKSGFETIHYESWPRSVTTGKINIFNYFVIKILKKFSLTDYIVCVAKKT